VGILERLRFLRPRGAESFADGFGVLTPEDRSWEELYRRRWQSDRTVRSTHGVNCTGSCGWKVYVKGGIVTWETQVLDYPRSRPGIPDHEPRGCARGASASWYLYSAGRLKYPLMRRRLIELWREARRTLDPVEAWRSIAADPERVRSYKAERGRGGFVRVGWDEANELVAAANVDTIQRHGPDRIAGFSPIPAMSMVSYAAGTRYLSLLGGTTLSFYDWYADLPPASPQTWGEQTDVPESADWYNSAFLMVWGSNVPQTRTPDAHFLAEVRYKGTKTVVVTPDFSEASKFADLWLAPTRGTDAALALALGHAVLQEFHVRRPTPYFLEYCRKFTDLPLLVMLERRGGQFVPGRMLRASDFPDALGQEQHAEWKTVGLDAGGRPVVPPGSAGFRWDDAGRWKLADEDAATGAGAELRLTLLEPGCETLKATFPYFGASSAAEPIVMQRCVPIRWLGIGGESVAVTTAYDLLLAHYGVERGLPGEALEEGARPYTPQWQEAITGIPARRVETVAREFAETAARTQGRSMVIIGTGVNQWFHGDMTYRAVINLLLVCGCVGKPGGGWAHYVGQEKLRPQAGWSALAFALDWQEAPRQMNGTSYWYVHSDQWRYERRSCGAWIAPTAPAGDWDVAPLDYNARAVRMGWLPFTPELQQNPLEVGRKLRMGSGNAEAHVVEGLRSGELGLAIDDPDAPQCFPRNLFIWRSNLLGASGKGHEYFLRHLVGAPHGVLEDEAPPDSPGRPSSVRWRDPAPEGKLDLIVTIDFRMSSTGLYSDVVLPTATWYEKNDLSTTDMHPFIHPLTRAVDPLWECKSDWEIFKGIARTFSRLASGKLGVETDVVLRPIPHDDPRELAQPLGVADWTRGECAPVPGVNMPSVHVVERNYPQTYDRFVAIGPNLEERGYGTKGLRWSAQPALERLARINGTLPDPGPTQGRVRIDTDVAACEAILALSPETCGEVAVRAWRALESRTGLELAHVAEGRAAEAIRFDDLVAQPRRVISSPTWSGIEAENVEYTGSYMNVHQGIPWRTLTGRQQLYQDHAWMRAFGEGFPLYRPPLDPGQFEELRAKHGNGNPEKVLSFLTPHQKWGIHSSFSDTQPMLALSRGGPCVWISEDDARELGIADNDWIEAYNGNGALAARAVVSQRIPRGVAMMYHAQDKIVYTPGTETTRTRGLHNSVSRILVKPTHMIGGYAHLSYGFNYYGTVGANRDECVVLRRMSKLDWLDGTPVTALERTEVRP
jgi:nitrate reductase / nitrite oxidoreductase, alpha subunit